ncbi:MAG: PSD1 and planctomycete cytochrome C domain-containing protein [Akkermansiaceae bacterium]
MHIFTQCANHQTGTPYLQGFERQNSFPALLSNISMSISKRNFFLILAAFSFSGISYAEVSFNRDVRPIFQKHCTACHGGVKEAGGISFIFRERLLIEGDSGQIAVVPGKPEDSEILRRVRSKDPDEIMPQPKHGPPLSESEIATLEKWIVEGAKWQEHWAFVPPVDTTIEGLKDEAWVSKPLDRHVLKKIEDAGLKPSEQASAAEWLRRVSFDVTGLPPTVEQITNLEARWEKDGQSARKEIVNQLLSSPAYGERWATVWLDLARYADTFGFEKDPHRDIWPWRDWVIRSLNADMPYDQFTIEQMAGDLLPNPTPDQILATAFHRNSQTNTEGGTDDEEFRVAAVIDRISTVWTTWQATTFGCVQCHSHPYDPISHDEFYEFMDFFNQSEDSDLNYEFPKMKLAGEAFVKMENELRDLREQLDTQGHQISDVAWKQLQDVSLKPQHGTLEIDNAGMITSEGTLRRGTTHKISGKTSSLDAIKVSIFPKSDDPKDWPEMGVMVTDFKLEKVGADGKRTNIAMAEVISDFLIGPSDPMSAFEGDTFKPFIRVGSRGSGGKGFGEYPRLTGPRWFVLLPEKRVQLGEGERIEISLTQGANANESQGTYLRRFKIEVAQDNRYAALLENPKRQEAWKSVHSKLDQLAAMKGTEVPIMRDRSKSGRRDTRVFARGNRMTKEHTVKGDVPDLLKRGYEGGENATRLEMAQWLVSGENPLTARVMANRLWGEIFGIGIVETAEDFGTSGTKPSNLELLDHLALRFQNDHNWSIKETIRDIVLSSTYLQTSSVSPELIERDPKNQLVARGPRNRLTAEMVRDQALAVSGLLSDKMFGSSVFPPQPKGVWSSVYSGAKWRESKGEDKYRRGIYTYMKRTSGFPGFLTFDAPSRDVCSARRIVSNTPLQALVTMNDPAHIEAAAALADKMRENGSTLKEQLSYAYVAATQRQPDEEILAELENLYEDLKNEKESKTPTLGLDPALTLTANTILNLDATLSK